MPAFLAPALYALLVWWLSTAAIILLNNLPQWTARARLAGGTAAFAAAMIWLWQGRNDLSTAGAYAAFTCAMLAWGWQEMTFFMGALTGPRRTGAPPGSTLGQVFRHGVAACLWHELAIIATAGVLAVMAWHGTNWLGLEVFLLLWVMRQSAKLNFWLGVLNLGEQFLPAHIGYMRSFMRKRPMNLLMPVSITAGTLLTASLCGRLAQPGLSSAETAGLSFLATMSALAVIEHWMMIAPIPFDRLWNWVLRWRRPAFGFAAPNRTLRGAASRSYRISP